MECLVPTERVHNLKDVSGIHMDKKRPIPGVLVTNPRLQHSILRKEERPRSLVRCLPPYQEDNLVVTMSLRLTRGMTVETRRGGLFPTAVVNAMLTASCMRKSTCRRR